MRGVYVSALLLFLNVDVGAALPGLKTSCTSTEAEEGGSGEIECLLGANIDVFAETFFLHITKEGQAGDQFHCYGDGSLSRPRCESDSCFRSDGLEGHRLTLVCSNVTADVNGTYKLRVTSNDKHTDVADFQFLVRERGAGTPESATEDKPIFKTIVSVVSGILVVIVSVVAAVRLLRNLKRRYPFLRQPEENNSDFGFGLREPATETVGMDTEMNADKDPQRADSDSPLGKDKERTEQHEKLIAEGSEKSVDEKTFA